MKNSYALKRAKVLLISFLFIHVAHTIVAQNGESLDFHNDNDVVYLRGPVDYGGGDWSVELWFKPEDMTHGTGSSRSLLFSTNGRVHNAVRVQLQHDEVKLYTGSSAATQQTSSAIKITSSWHHIAVVYEKNMSSSSANPKLKFYLDAVMVHEINNPNMPTDSTFSNFQLGTNIGTFYAGRMDELRIWKKALSTSFIEDNFDKEWTDLDDPDLVRLFDFNIGNPGGDNSQYSLIPNLSTADTTVVVPFMAHLAGFNLNGNKSNFVSGSPFKEFIIANSIGDECLQHISTGSDSTGFDGQYVGQTFRLGTVDTITYTLDYVITALYTQDDSSTCNSTMTIGSWAGIHVYEVDEELINNMSTFKIGKYAGASLSKRYKLNNNKLKSEYLASFDHDMLSDSSKTILTGGKLYALIEVSGGNANHNYVVSSTNGIRCVNCFAFTLDVNGGLKTIDPNNNDHHWEGRINSGVPIEPQAGLDLYLHLVAVRN